MFENIDKEVVSDNVDNNITTSVVETNLPTVEPTDPPTGKEDGESTTSDDGLNIDIKPTNKLSEFDDILRGGQRTKTNLKQGYQTDINVEDYEAHLPGFNPTIERSELNKARASNQSNLEQAGHMGMQMLGDIVGGTISGVGSIFELPDAVIDSLSGQGADFNNFLIEWGEGIKEYTRENNQIYKENPNQSFDLLDPAWWFSGGVSLASTVGLMIPAIGAVKGVSLITKILGYSDKIGKTTKYWGKIATSASVMRNAENMTESLSVANKSRITALKQMEDNATYEKLKHGELGQELKEKGLYTSKENIAKLIASKAGWRSYKVNSINIIFDAVQLAPIFKGFRAASRTNKVVTKKVEKALRGHGYDKFGKITYKSNKYKRFFSPVTSPLSRQFTEGIEEGINFIGGAEGEYYGKFLSDKGDDSTFGARLGEYLQDGHFYESAFWGIGGGIAFEGATHGVTKLQSFKDNSTELKINEIKQRQDVINSYGKAHSGIVNDTNLSPLQKKVQVNQIQDEMATDLGMRAAAIGNIDLLLEHIGNEKFQEDMITAGLADTGNVATRVEEVSNIIRKTEESYNEYYNKVFTGSESMEVKNHIITTAIKLDSGIHRNKEYKKQITTTLNKQKGRNTYIQDNAGNGINEKIEIKAIENAITYLKGTEYESRIPNLEKILKEKKETYKSITENNKSDVSKISSDIIDAQMESFILDEAINYNEELLGMLFKDNTRKKISDTRKKQINEIKRALKEQESKKVEKEQKESRLSRLKSFFDGKAKTTKETTEELEIKRAKYESEINKIIESRKEKYGIESKNIVEDITSGTERTIFRAENGIPTDPYAISTTIDYIYGKVKEVEALKKEENKIDRVNSGLTTEQLNTIYNELSNILTHLINYETSQRSNETLPIANYQAENVDTTTSKGQESRSNEGNTDSSNETEVNTETTEIIGNTEIADNTNATETTEKKHLGKTNTEIKKEINVNNVGQVSIFDEEELRVITNEESSNSTTDSTVVTETTKDENQLEFTFTEKDEQTAIDNHKDEIKTTGTAKVIVEEVTKPNLIYTKLNDNSVSTLTDEVDEALKNKEILRSKESNRVFNGVNILAYLSRGYEEIIEVANDGTETFTKQDVNNKLNDGLLDKQILNPRKYKVGTKLTIKVDKAYKNNTSTFSTLQASEKTPNSLIPIAIYNNGKKVAYLHDLNWINSNNISGDVEMQQKQLQDIRNYIAENGEIEVTINEKSPGKLIKTHDKRQIETTHAFPDKKLQFLIGKDNSFFEGNGRQTTDSILNEANDGEIYAKALVDDNSKGLHYIAIPLRRKKVSKLIAQSIRNAVDLHLSNDKTNKTVVHINNEFDINILTTKGLKEYINKFINVYELDGSQSLQSKLKGLSSDVNLLTVTTNSIDFGGGKGIAFNSVSKNTVDSMPEDVRKEVLDSLESRLQLMYTNFDINKINTKGKVIQPIINLNSRLDEVGVSTVEHNSYNDFIKANTTTNLMSFDLGNGEFTYTVQPVISTNVHEVVVGKKIDKEFKRSVENNETNINKKSDVLNKETNDLEDDLLSEVDNFSPSVRKGNINYIKIQEAVHDSVLITGFTSFKQDIIVSAMAYDLNDQINKKGKLNQAEVFDNWLTYFKDRRDKYNTSDKAIHIKITKEFDKIINNFEGFKKFTLVKIAKLNSIKVKSIENIDTVEDLESLLEKTNFDDSASIQTDSKDTISIKLKRFFSGVYEVTEDNKIITPYLGLKKYVPFDTVYNEVSSILSNQPADFHTMLQVLKSNVKYKPYLQQVINDLENTTQQVRNQFTVAMSKHEVKMTYLLIGKKGEGYSLRTSDSNSSSKSKSLHKHWYNKIKSSKYTTQKDGKLYFNDKIDDVIEVFKEYEKTPPTAKDLHEVLNDIGIDVDIKTVENLVENGIRDRNVEVSYKALFTARGRVFKVLADKLKNGKNTDILENSPLDDKSIKKLASLDSKYKAHLFSNSYTDSKGNIVYSFSNNKYFTDRIYDLQNNVKLVSDLRELAYYKNSDILTSLSDENSNVFKEVFDYFYLDSIKKEKSKKKGKKTSQLSDTELEIFRLGLFQNQGNVLNGKRIIKMFYPTMSDKSTITGITTVGHETKFNLDDEIDNDTIEKIYNSLVVPEIARAVAYNKKGKSKIKYYDKGANVIFSIPEVNDIEGLRDSNGNIVEVALADKDLVIAMKNAVKTHVNNLVNEKLKLWKDVGINKSSFTDTIYNKYATSKITNSNNVLKYTASDFVINTLITDQNIFQAFVGDPAMFAKSKSNNYSEIIKDTFENIGKRLASQIAPGLDLADNEHNEYRQGFIADREIASSYLDEYSQYLDESDLKDYGKIESTDAQEFTTVKEHLYVMEHLGHLTDEEVIEIQKASDKGTLSVEQLGKIMQPMKPVTVAQVIDKEEGVQRMLYIKSSSFPLIPQITEGLEIDKLRIAMENPNTGVDRVSFSTANKIGDFVEPAVIFNEDGTIKDNLDLGATSVVLKRKYFKIQQEIPFKEIKGKINDGSQQRKLLFMNLLHIDGMTELKAKFDSTYNKLYKLHYDELITELNIQEDGTFDTKKLHKMLVAEAVSRDYSINDIQSLKIDSNGEFIFPLAFNNSASKFESLMTSIVDNKIRKKKFRGNSFILGTEEGFKWQPSVKESGISESSIVFTDKFDGELKPQRPAIVNGKKVILPAQILIPFKFRDSKGKLIDAKTLLGKNNKLDLSKLDENILESLGFRIPTQGLNSMSAMEVVGFLPKTAGDLIIAPKEFVIQMGSDFDVDKLFTYMYNTTMYNGKMRIINNKLINEVIKDFDVTSLQELRNDFNSAELKEIIKEYKEINDEIYNEVKENKEIEEKFNVRISETRELYNKLKLNNELKQLAKLDLDTVLMLDDLIHEDYVLQNNLLDIHFEVLKNPHYDVQSQVLEPLGFGTLKQDAITLSNYVKATETFSPLSDAYQKMKYLNASAGKAGVGVFSMDSVFNVMLQGKDIELLDEVGRPMTIKFGNIESNKLSDTRVADDNKGKKLRFKSQIIAAFQSAAVDNEKEQILDKLNINSYTFDTIAILSQLGFQENVTTAFISQPIIKEFIKRSIKQKEITNESGTFKNIGKELLNEFEEKLISGTTKDIGYDVMLSEIEQNDAFSNNQLDVLNKFLKLDKIGKEFKLVQKAVNSDSSGIPNSLIETNDKAQQVKDLFSNTTFKNISSIVGTVLPNSNKLTANEFVRNITPTTINGNVIVYGIGLNNKLWNNIFHYEKPNIQVIFNRLLSINTNKDSSTTQKNDLKKKIWTSIKSYIFTNSQNPLLNKDITQLRYELMSDVNNKSLGQKLLSISTNPILLNNAFLNKLSVNKLNDISTIEFSSSKGENFEEISIYASFADLLINDRLIDGISTRELALDLIRYQYVNGGVQEAKQFIKYIPVELLNEIGFNKFLNNVVETVDMNFIQQFMQHNVFNVSEVSDAVKDTHKINADEIVVNFSGIKIKNYKSYPTLINDKGMFSEYIKIHGRLYKKVPKTKSYKLLQTLGNENYVEYNSSVKNVTTLETTNKEKITPEIKPTYNEDNTNNVSLKDYGVSEEIEESQRTINFLTNVIKNSKDKFYVETAKLMLKNISKLDTKIHLDTSLNADGAFIDNSIFINPSKDFDIEKVVMHELVHAFTVQGLKVSNRETTRLKGIFTEFKGNLNKQELQDVLEKLGKLKKGEDKTFTQRELDVIYAGVNIEEFVALAITSKDVRTMLNNKKFNKNKSFLVELIERFVKVIKNVLGINTGSQLQYVVNDIFDLIENTEKVTKVDKFNTRAEDVIYVESELGLLKTDGSREKINKSDTKYIADVKRAYNARLPKEFKLLTNENSDGSISFYVQPVVVYYSGSSESSNGDNTNFRFDTLRKETRRRINVIKSSISRAKNDNNHQLVVEQQARLTEVREILSELEDAEIIEDIKFYAENDIEIITNIINNKKATISDLIEAEKLIAIWEKGVDLFFTKDEKTSDDLVNEFTMYQIKANRLNEKLVKKQEELARKIIKDTYGEDVLIADVFKEFKDVSTMKANTLDISHLDNVLIQAVFKNIKITNDNARKESQRIARVTDNLVEKAIGVLGKGVNKYEVFKQLTKSGTWTGDLVSRFSKEYEDTARTKYKIAKRINTNDAWNTYYKWRNDNEVIFDVRILFDNEESGKKYSKEEIKSHKDTLLKNLGKNGYNQYHAKVKKKVENYLIYKELEQDRINALSDINEEEKVTLMKNWTLENSPYYASSVFATGKVTNTDIKIRGFQNTEVIPKKEGTKWYDSNFEKIENNEDLLNLYNHIYNTFGTLNSVLPEYQKKNVSNTSVPLVRDTVVDTFTNAGINAGFKHAYEKLIEDGSVKQLSDTTHAEKDLVTGRVEDKLKVAVIQDTNSKFKALIKFHNAEFEINNNRKPNVDERYAIRDEVYNIINSDKSFDLGQLTKVYTSAVMSYKYKASVEGELSLMKSILNKTKETEFNAKDEKLSKTDGTLAKKAITDSFIEVKSMVDSFSHAFYDKGKQLEGVGSKVIFTPKEKIEKKRIEELIIKNNKDKKDGFKDRDELLVSQLNALGRNNVLSKKVDQGLQYVQLKSMSYNVISGFANMAFGFLDNITEASDGRLFNTKEYMTGMGITLRSFGSSNDNAIRVSNLMQIFDTLKDASNELYETKDTKTVGKYKALKKFLQPYQVQKSTEYVNQAPVMIAMLMHAKVKGTEISLWDSLNSDGTIKEGSKLTNEQLDDFKVSLDQNIKKLHGNYDPDSKIKGKDKVLGRALMQFRTWMFEGANKRFGAEFNDRNLGTVRKGRYITVYQNANVETLVLSSKMLLRKLTFNTTFKNTKFEDHSRFSEVDAANMRANLTELVIYASLFGLAVLTKMTDDDDEKTNFVGNMMLNQILRLQTDVEFYLSPTAFEALTKSSIPAMSLVTDFSQLISAMGRFVLGDDEIGSGVNSGDSRLLRELSQMLPLTTQMYRIKSSGSQVFDK